MRTAMQSLLLGMGVAAFSVAGASAQVSDDVVKIGVLTDMSGPASTPTGQGSVTAAQMAVEDFGGTVLGKKIEVIVGDHQLKPDVGAGIARRWYDTEKVDVIVDVPVSSVGLAVQAVAKEKQKLFITHSTGTADFHGKFCTPYAHPVGVRHPRARGRHRQGDHQARRRQLVLHHRQLRVRPFARKGCLRGDRGERRQGGGLGEAAVCRAGAVLVHPAGAGLEGEGHRHRRRPAEQHQRDQARRRVRRHQGRPADGRPPGADHRHPRARPEDRAGAGADHVVLLGHGRQDPRLVEALFRQDAAHADDVAGRRLFVGDRTTSTASRTPAPTSR